MTRSLLRPSLLLLAASLTSCAAAEAFVRKNLWKVEVIDGKQEGPAIFYYPDGTKKAEGVYEGDRQVGPWTYYHPNRVIEWQGIFDRGRIHGPSTFYWETGDKRAEGEFVMGMEEGRWVFWDDEGRPQMHGDFVRGVPSMLWTYLHPDGKFAAQGYRIRGEKVGLWQFWDEEQNLYEKTYPMPGDVELVDEPWDNGVPRRQGFVSVNGKTGRWITHHRNGLPRAMGDFEAGLASGTWTFWNPSGEMIARGPVRAGRCRETWDYWVDGEHGTISGGSIRPPVEGVGEFTPDEWCLTQPVNDVVSMWLGEASSSVDETFDQTRTEGAGEPPSELLLLTDVQPSVPLRAQPWTTSERSALQYLVTRYKEGESAATPPPNSRYGKRSATNAAGGAEEESKGDLALSEPLMNHPLPSTIFYTGLGEEVDLDSLKGRKYVVLVVLRGFAREVCVYCVTQTEALAQSVEAFGEVGAEIFVVYPGNRDRLKAFMEAFNETTELEGDIPIGVLYDPGLDLVTKMGIESELAIPSTFILDLDGVVRYAYVGTSIEDRPPAKDLLEAVKRIAER